MDLEEYNASDPSQLTSSGRHCCPHHFALKTTYVTEQSLPERQLRYSIKSYSSFSQTYKPCNVLENKPSDQASRWSADGNHLPQYLTLKLEKTSIVSSITFGKYEKPHVCNLKRFRVLGGLNEDHMSELFWGGLANNNIPEKFQLRHTSHGHIFPCNYIKIVPLLSWEQGFNCSIWYIELYGNDDESIVQPTLKSFTNFRERQAMRLCLKHLRQRSYMDEFENLQKKTCVQLEDPQLTKLYKLLVVEGDFIAAEKILTESARVGLFADYVAKQPARAEWNALKPNRSSKCMWPGIRGGHQMLVDPKAQMLYLFGGWDGLKDLADLWCYDIQGKQWNCLSMNTERDGGPSARSCHKMCIDCVNKKIYTLGRFVDQMLLRASSNNSKNDFYCYDIMSNTWTQLSDDTEANGGPQLVYEHQMCMDVMNQTIYVSGGRIRNLEGDDLSYSTSGFFVYHCPTNTWKQLSTIIPPRIGHLMVFHEVLRKLYFLGGQVEDSVKVLSGQSNSKYFTDIYIYDVDEETVVIVKENEQIDISRDSYMQSLRAAVDSEFNEIYILKGHNQKDSEGQLSNSFWIYNIETCKWSCLYKSSSDQRLIPNPPEPCPRFAHQLAYDCTKKVHYLFAGNQGQTGDHKMRLDDFWMLKVIRVHVNDILHTCQHMVRKQRFAELSRDNPLEALTYLQRDLAEVVNHDDPIEREEFQSLVSVLFKQSPRLADGEASLVPGVASADIFYTERIQLFDRLTVYFPLAMTQPKEDLVDLIGF